MRRGYYLESQIEKVLAYLDSIGIHGHKNHARRTVDGAYLEGEPFDYEVFCSPPHCFDAKETRGKAWPLRNAKPGQVRHLLNCKRQGAEAYFLVLFEGGKLRRFDVEFVAEALKNDRKSLSAEEGSDWDWEELATSRKG